MTADEFYSACQLTGNPFRSNAVADDDPRVGIWIGYERQKSQFVKMLERVRADQVGLTNFVLLYGNWGTGKSHALLWAKNRVREAEHGSAYFMPTLKRDKGKLSFAAAFAEDAVGRGTIVADLMSFKNFCDTRILEVKSRQPQITNDGAIDEFIKQREMAEFVKRLMTCQNEGAIKTFLNSERLSDYQAVMLFAKIVNLFVQEYVTPLGRNRFRQAVYLFIDELDDLSRSPAKDVLETNDVLRHLYDACPNSFGLVCALSAEVTTLSNIFTDYVLSRITRHVHFDMLDRESAIKFVQAILAVNRPAGVVARGDFFPFDEDAINGIMSQLHQITPRKIVNTMQQVIEECRLSGANPTDGPITNDVLEELDILEAIFGDDSVS
ncbi:hypothetical protein [Janthinobacterium lividum]|uniref:Uncharacterized protein n=1 Tax=Janthinobacterium lividum TaxID=29581 RepID=A0ABU0XRF3_9BURK|nr:hypothetical protein [Janthinobacterium lividum]MDQ4626108.1 hypothetical protein [Janthinobacterium lividum]MDQ4674925.1 hypothetical protein [Janthinobacterium lividum]MDQ4685657.1 hypothetical protein [Janthinobacterium lividum]